MAQADFDLKIVPDNKVLHQGEEFNVDVVLVTRKAGVQGWSYGIRHDPNLLDIVSCTTAGTDTLTLFNGGFQQTVISVENSVNVGWTQGILLSWSDPNTVVPISPKFVMGKARYKVRTGICGTASELAASLTFASDLVPMPGSPPLDLNVTVEGKPVAFNTEGTNLSIQCPSVELTLAAQAGEQRKLIADKTDVLPINLALKNGSAAATDIQGWSYGVSYDPSKLTVVGITSGPAVAALHGNLGPDFHSYNFEPILASTDGKVKGATVGVVISLNPPQEDVLPVPAGEMKVLEVMRVKSTQEITTGADEDTQVAFVSEVLPGDRPIENIIVVEGKTITPKSESLTVTLTAKGVSHQFKRGEINGDGRFDIADVVTFVEAVFLMKKTLLCQQAADANDDGQLNAADVVWMIDYEFRGSGKAPAAPFTSCGTDPTAHSLSCNQPTGKCS